MCRSHELKILLLVMLNLILWITDIEVKDKYRDIRMTPKKRTYWKKSAYDLPFHARTSRIVRQRTRYTSRYLERVMVHIQCSCYALQWKYVSNEQIMDGYETDDTVSTLELVD